MVVELSDFDRDLIRDMGQHPLRYTSTDLAILAASDKYGLLHQPTIQTGVVDEIRSEFQRLQPTAGRWGQRINPAADVDATGLPRVVIVTL